VLKRPGVVRTDSLGWEERRAIKTSRFSDAQKAFILKQGADGIPVGDNFRTRPIYPTPKRYALRGEGRTRRPWCTFEERLDYAIGKKRAPGRADNQHEWLLCS
jgi:hypothetical protein